MGLAHINRGGSSKDAALRLKTLDSPVTVEPYLPSLSLSGSMSLGGEKREIHSVGGLWLRENGAKSKQVTSSLGSLVI